MPGGTGWAGPEPLKRSARSGMGGHLDPRAILPRRDVHPGDDAPLLHPLPERRYIRRPVYIPLRIAHQIFLRHIFGHVIT